jgi:hypothetical protein
MTHTSRVLAPRINEETWEHHRNTIHRLFVDEERKLDGLGGVMDIMRGKYGFTAR